MSNNEKKEMTLNEIKKALYREKPMAGLFKRGSVYHYFTMLKDGKRINFEVPVSDMGDAPFKDEMEAQLLIRWIKQTT